MTAILSEDLETSTVTRPRSRGVAAGIFGWLGLLVLLAGFVALIWWRFAPAISEPDDNGYFAQGTLLAQTGKTWFTAASDAQYIGMHWLVTPAKNYISRYPPGLAVVIAAVYKIAGWRASVWVNPVLSALALVGLFVLVRREVSTGWALVAAAVLEANPTFVHHALAGDSHMGVTCVLVWGLYFLLRWAEEGKLWLAFAAGLALGCIPTIRYPDAIMGIGAVIFLLSNWRRFPRIWRHYLAMAIGAAVVIVPLLVRNQLLLGAFWRTGYSLTNEETGFSLEYFKAHAIDYIRQINGNGIGILFAVGFAGMICMIFKGGRRGTRTIGLMSLLMTTAMLLVYMAYYWAPEMNSAMTLRFLLPTYPLYILAAMWMLREACGEKARGTQVALGLAVITVQLLWGTTELLAQTDQLHYQKQSLALVTAGLEKTAMPGDVIVGNGNVLQQLDFVRQWKIADGSLLRGEGMGFGGGGPGGPGGPGGEADINAPSPMQAEKLKLQRAKYPGTTAQKEKKFVADISTWAGSGHHIYIVGTEAVVNQWNGVAGGKVKIVTRIPLPKMPEETTNAGGLGGPGGGRGGMGARAGRQMGGGGMGGMGGGGGFGFGGPGGIGGPGFGGPPGMGGGFPGGRAGGGRAGGPMGGFAGETEIVIGEFTPAA